MALQIPSKLAILPLPPDVLVFPGLSFSIHLTSRHAVELIRSLVKDASLGPNKSSIPTPLIVGCVPLRVKEPKDDSGPVDRKAGGEREAKGLGADEGEGEGEVSKPDGRKAPLIPREGVAGEGGLDGGKPVPEELFEYGVASRISRLERVSNASGGGFIVVVEGLSRFSFNPSSLSGSTPFYTSILDIQDPALAFLPSSHGPLLSSLRSTATSLVTTLSASSILPSLFLRQLRNLLATLSLASAPALVDAFIGTLPLSTSGLTHSDKLLILSLTDGVTRVEKGIELLARVDETIKLTKRVGERIEQSAQRRAKAQALMQQLIAIRQELDDLARENRAGGTKGVVVPSSRGKTGSRGGASSRPPPLISEEGAEEEEEEEDELAVLEKKLKEKAFSEEARSVAMKELKRLKKSPPQGAEHGIIQNYLDTLLSLPWTTADSTPLPTAPDFLKQARQKLDTDHYGLEKIKKRLLEWLAVLRLQQDQALATLPPPPTPSSFTETALAPSTETAVVLREPSVPPAPSSAPSTTLSSPPHPCHHAPILLLHGPPGTGKTSIATSLAEAMGRKFVRISLGGVTDEASIRGHRRTYVGAMPGRIVAALKKCGVINPVVLLDEVDKVSSDSGMRGNPSAALLEVLDPSQNHAFEDHYVGIPMDLSQVLFICTANNINTIEPALFDRMEPVALSGYVHDEKLHIARQSLLPKQLLAHCLTPSLFSISEEVLLSLITHYTQEAGVRSLDRHLATVARAKAVEYAEAKEEGVVAQRYRAEVTEKDVERILGTNRYDPDEAEKGGNSVGVATGLAYMGSGQGGILQIESTHFPGSGGLKTTGQLGEVIQESANVALSWVKAHSYELGISNGALENPFKSIDLHVHLPAGAVKKDGPSAGVAMTVALVSLMLGIPTIPGIGMTGEITLTGAVTPVGGIKEKVLAARRAGLKTLLLPLKNKRDYDADVPASVKADVEFVFVERVEEALEVAFGGKVKLRARAAEMEGTRGGKEWVESRL